MEESQVSQNKFVQEKPAPRVSIGMPVYNGGEYIREAIESLLAQTYTDFELVISDNASTDETETICRDYENRDARVKFIRQPVNIGAINNFNFLLRHARGVYFAWMAHDDYLDISFLEKTVRYLDDHPDVANCLSDSNVVKNGKIVRARVLNEIRDSIDWAVARRKFFTYLPDLVMPIYGLFRLSILQDHNIYLKAGFRGTIYGLERSILPKVALRGRIVALPELLQFKRVQDNSLSVTEPGQVRQLRLFINVIYIITKYQAREAFFSKLTVHQKVDIFIEMLSRNFPIIVHYAWQCIPRKSYLWLANMKIFHPLRERLQAILVKER